MVHSSQRRSFRIDGICFLSAACAGSIPDELGRLNRLEVLRLDDNKLTGMGVDA